MKDIQRFRRDLRGLMRGGSEIAHCCYGNIEEESSEKVDLLSQRSHLVNPQNSLLSLLAIQKILMTIGTHKLQYTFYSSKLIQVATH